MRLGLVALLLCLLGLAGPSIASPHSAQFGEMVSSGPLDFYDLQAILFSIEARRGGAQETMRTAMGSSLSLWTRSLEARQLLANANIRRFDLQATYDKLGLLIDEEKLRELVGRAQADQPAGVNQFLDLQRSVKALITHSINKSSVSASETAGFGPVCKKSAEEIHRICTAEAN